MQQIVVFVVLGVVGFLFALTLFVTCNYIDNRQAEYESSLAIATRARRLSASGEAKVEEEARLKAEEAVG